MTAIDTILLILSTLYLVLAIKNKVWCFYVAIIQCSIWGYVSYMKLDLVFDSLLQAFYIVMAFWGIYNWSDQGNKIGLPISKMSGGQHFATVFFGSVVSLLVAFISTRYFSAAYIYLDAVTTGFAIIATFLMVYRKLENWIYWVIIDLAYMYIYIKQGSIVLAVIMFMYSMMAFYGYFSWRKKASV